MPNQSIIAVPINFKDLGEVRQFLLKLVETVDIALGYRGEKPTVEQIEIPNLIASFTYDEEELAATNEVVINTATKLNAVIAELQDLGVLARA